MHQKRPFRAHKGDDGFNPTHGRASKGDRGFRQPAQLADRARRRCPWATARPGRATSGRPTLQTSSNQHDLNRLARISVTNVVNLSPKTSISSEKADGLTTFVTTGQKSTRKTPWIDDVCNNTHQATRQHTMPHRCGGCRRNRRAWPRCRWAAAGPGRASRRRAEPIISTPGSTGVEGAGGTGGHGRASRHGAEQSGAA